MAAQEVFNPLYQQVRQLGLPYQIKESGGSIVIRISSDNKHYFQQDKEKFRFHTMRTFNGSRNSNWRSPQNYEENSFVNNDSTFPDINFFRTTPPPQRPTPPPTPSAARPPVSQPSAQKSPFAPAEPTSVPTAVSSGRTKSPSSPEKSFQEPFHRTSTPLNPYRCTSQVVLQKTSSHQSSSGQVSASELMSASHSPVITPSALSTSVLSKSPPRTQAAAENRILLTAEDREALKQLLLVYK